MTSPLVKIVYGLLAALLVAGALFIANDYGRKRAYESLHIRAQSAAELNAVLLRTVLEKQRSLPFVLSQDRDVISALTTRSDSLLQLVNRKLESLISGTRSSVIYLLNADGLALASSNWREPTSFVGTNYSFRPYYTRAVATGSAEHYAFGTVSKRPGLYISRRIDGPSGTLGVIVVKVEFDDLEADWRRNSDPSLVVDQRGIVLITSLPGWRFMTEGPIVPDQMGPIRESLQFGDAPLAPLDITACLAARPSLILSGRACPARRRSEEFVRVQTPVPTTTWNLQLLTPAASAVSEATRTAQLLALIVLAPLLGLTRFFLAPPRTGTAPCPRARGGAA